MRTGEDPNHFFSRVYGLRDQLREIGEGVNSMRLTALAVNFVSSIYKLVRELRYKDDN